MATLGYSVLRTVYEVVDACTGCEPAAAYVVLLAEFRVEGIIYVRTRGLENTVIPNERLLDAAAAQPPSRSADFQLSADTH